MAGLIVFDDRATGAADLTPLTDLLASFELRTGALSTAGRLSRHFNQPICGAIVPDGLAPLLATRFDGPINRLPEDEEFLLVNGRWATPNERLPDELNTATVDETGAVVAAYLDAEHAAGFISGGELPDDVDPTPLRDAGLLRKPWDLLTASESGNLFNDLQHITHVPVFNATAVNHVAAFGEHPLRINPTAVVEPFVLFDTAVGPIVIDEGAHVHAHSVIRGPCYIGPGTHILSHAQISDSAVGPACKIGGEVAGAVFQGYANKAHFGFIGDSYVGEWVNLGAGTTTSNLKNTYGPVSMLVRTRGKPEPTGRRFLGSIIGDHVKTAIGTRLPTGAVIHTGAMIAVSSFAPKCVQRFAFLTDKGAARYELERFALVADRMMQRRSKRVTAELTQRLAELHAE